MGTNYYRLKQIDTDGKTAYSSIAAVTFQGTNFLTVFPNPTTDQISVRFKEAAEVESMGVYNLKGQLMREVKSVSILSLKGLPSGVYQVKIRTKEGRVYHKSIVKN